MMVVIFWESKIFYFLLSEEGLPFIWDLRLSFGCFGLIGLGILI